MKLIYVIRVYVNFERKSDEIRSPKRSFHKHNPIEDSKMKN